MTHFDSVIRPNRRGGPSETRSLATARLRGSDQRSLSDSGWQPVYWVTVRFLPAIAVALVAGTFATFVAIPIGLCCLPVGGEEPQASCCDRCVNSADESGEPGPCTCCPVKLVTPVDSVVVPAVADVAMPLPPTPVARPVSRRVTHSLPRGPPRASELQRWLC